MRTFAAIPSLAAVVLLMAVAGSQAAPSPQNRRFILDNVANVIHAVVDPIENLLAQSLHTLVAEFDHLVHGRENIQTVVCKLPVETGGTMQDKIDACVSTCMDNAGEYLGDDSSHSANETCPIACTYAYNHPTAYTC